MSWGSILATLGTPGAHLEPKWAQGAKKVQKIVNPPIWGSILECVFRFLSDGFRIFLEGPREGFFHGFLVICFMHVGDL